MSPAMAAGITEWLWSIEEIVTKLDEMAPAPKPRGPYRKRSYAREHHPTDCVRHLG
jgi:hypothetical protein